MFGADEVVIRSWTNGGSGPAVLICNGLGAPAACWPGLYDDDECGLEVVGFNHRGTAGSSRPLDESATFLSDHAEDALAVMDAYELASAVVVGWSFGVPVAFLLADRAPDRVAAVSAVCGVPAGREGLRRMISAWNSAVGAGAMSAAQVLPPQLLDLLGQLPVGSATVQLLRSSGLLSPTADPQHVRVVLERFLEQDPQWYLRLARTAAASLPESAGPPPTCPVQFTAAREDPFVPWQTVVAVADEIPQASCEVVAGSHFLPLENPGLIRARIAELVDPKR